MRSNLEQANNFQLSLPNRIIEETLCKFKSVIGDDYDRYRNHVYRVFANCLLIDKDEGNREKYAIAAVFHDIGIWTDHTIDYLKPSITQATVYLSETNKEEWIGEISLMIHWHHKISPYSARYSQLVETFRKADWIDVSLGVLTFGYDRKEIMRYRYEFPDLGFHLFLIKKTTKNFFRHPLNPLPMFTK